MISLGGITLSDDMILVNLHEQSVLAGMTRRTLGGRLVRYQTQLTAGVALDLVATRTSGWITLATVNDILALQAVNNSMNLVYEDDTYLVDFRITTPPVVEMSPLIPRPNLEDTDWMFGTIKLITLA